MVVETREPGIIQTVRHEREPRPDVRQLAPATGLREYWYPVIEDRKVGNKPVGLKICDELLVFFRARTSRSKRSATSAPTAAAA